MRTEPEKFAAFSLTLTLSRWERESPLSAFKKSDAERAEAGRGFARTLETILPLRSIGWRGEGRGEVRFPIANG